MAKFAENREKVGSFHPFQEIFFDTFSAMTKEDAVSIKIITWNVNGLRSILQKTFDDLVQWEDPDILCLQETKVNHDIIPDVGFPQYAFRSYNCADRRGYAGTAMFEKSLPRSMDERTYVETLVSSHEGRVQVADFHYFYLLNVYIPNSQRELQRLPLRHHHWDKIFGEYLQNLAEKKPLIVCGDFNVAHQPIDLKRPEENRGNAGFTDEERNGFSAILEKGFVDAFRHFYPQREDAYSWWSYRANARARNIGWRIDYFLVSPQIIPALKRCEILSHVGGSDHAPVLLEMDAEIFLSKKKILEKI
ncbi:MAG: exodeoxyribonuclease III [Puniceicoccales bacterium]|jgi:exodeoxyribonuclease-3|nr:exodeoxyribonuclease III [Puniceicoccales bacterium]